MKASDVIEAGRETDARVAEVVMGWIEYRPSFDGSRRFHMPEGVESPSGWHPVKCGDDWCPSTSISDAWEVVEKVSARVSMEYVFELYLHEGGTWEAGFGMESAYADTAPLAICRAALAALEER